jgi:oligosaccharide repeat unit polymerase
MFTGVLASARLNNPVLSTNAAFSLQSIHLLPYRGRISFVNSFEYSSLENQLKSTGAIVRGEVESTKTLLRVILKALTVCFVFASLTLLSIGFATKQESLLLLGTGCALPIALLLPYLCLAKKTSLLEPIHLILVYLLIGSTATTFFLVFSSSERRDFLMFQEGYSFFLRGGLMLACGVALFSTAYSLTPFRFSSRESSDRVTVEIDGSRFVFLSVLLMCIAILGSFLFLKRSGGFTFSQITLPRYEIIETEDGVRLGGGGYYRALASFSHPCLLIYIAYLSRLRRRWRYRDIAIVCGLGFSTIFLPFLSNSRTEVVYVLLQILMIQAAFGCVSRPGAVVSIACALLLFSAMTFGRSLHSSDARTISSNPVVALASSGNGWSLVGTSLIVNRIPKLMPFKYGSSYLTWIYAPIPRSWWPEKPDLGLGREIKSKLILFGQEVSSSGRPPGVLGEGYINFGWLGFFGSAVFFGIVLRTFWNSFSDRIKTEPLTLVLYLLLLPSFVQLVNSGVSEFIVRATTEFALFVANLALISLFLPKYSVPCTHEIAESIESQESPRQIVIDG